MPRVTLITTAVVFFIVGRLLLADEPAAVEAEHARKMQQGLQLFKREVRPLLVGRCVKCHGGEKREADFDLTSREALLKGGADGAMVVPGKPGASMLVELIAQRQEPFMPEGGAPLSAASVSSIARWIELGAPYDSSLKPDAEDPTAWTGRQIDPQTRQFWSFQPLRQVTPPETDDAGWCRTPVDRFVWEQLQRRGLAPNPLTGKRALIRRAYFDLVGLPPGPREVEQFLADTSPDAYEKLLDRLLDNPHFGERWGRHWLDLARFAESHGFEQDYDRPHAYHFRDFVIRALNQDMPFDQFVSWQIAGDEIAPQNPLAMMATGFLGAGVFPTQITKNEVERTRYDALDDMLATTGTAMLGLTIGCARCHDHKFDPIPQGDYYRLLSTFTTTVRSNIDLDVDPSRYRKLKEIWNAEHAPLVAALEEFQQQQLPARFAHWLDEQAAAGPRGAEPPVWTILDVQRFESAGGATFQKLDDGSLLIAGKNADADTYTIHCQTTLPQLTAIRLEALAHPSLNKGGPGRAENGNFGLSRISVTARRTDSEGANSQGANREGANVPLQLARPRATFQQDETNLGIAASLDEQPKTGWAIDPQFGRDHAAVFEVEPSSWREVAGNGPVKLTIVLDFQVNKQHGIGRPRLAVSGAAAPVPIDGAARPQAVVNAFQQLARRGADELGAEDRAILLEWYKTQDPEWRALHGRVATHLTTEPKPLLTTVMVTSEGLTPIRHHTQGADFFEETYYLKRGDCDQKQGVATQGFLQILDSAPEGVEHWRVEPPAGWRTSYRRRALAHWITDTEYGPGHLLARVIVNRLWQHHMGQGIVATPNDFGAQGLRPTHPELLDWLAAELIRRDWQLKPIHRLIMNSAVYMQSTQYDAGKSRIDVENQWLWRRSPRRLEAEVIRDAMLSVSDELDSTMFGPGTLDEGQHRRSIYFMVKRSKLIPMMQLFDAPEPLVGVGGRPNTTIAPQALMFMNNPHVRQYAQSFAARAAPQAGQSWSDSVRLCYRIAVGREPTDAETDNCVSFIQRQLESYEANGQPGADRLALADFCQVLMSLNEFVYID